MHAPRKILSISVCWFNPNFHKVFETWQFAMSQIVVGVLILRLGHKRGEQVHFLRFLVYIEKRSMECIDIKVFMLRFCINICAYKCINLISSYTAWRENLYTFIIVLLVNL